MARDAGGPSVGAVGAPDTGQIPPLNRFGRALERIYATRAGAWLAINVASRVDRRLVRLSGGRLSMAIVRPVALLTTTGARSGLVRTTPLLFFERGREVVLIASCGGSPRHPAWYHNLKANPRCALLARGETARYVAREGPGEEREELWRRANTLYAGYDAYQTRTDGRRIPVMVLTPES